MLFTINRKSTEPIYRQIVLSIRDLVAREVLMPGESIPSTRRLSNMLGVSRRTVDQAFAILQAEGLIESHVGQGSFISQALPKPVKADQEVKSKTRDCRTSDRFWDSIRMNGADKTRLEHFLFKAAKAVPYSFVSAMPDPSLFPVQRFRRCVDKVLRSQGRRLAELSDTIGYYPLREDLAHHLKKKGAFVTPEEILITSGCQQSMDLICRLLLSREDPVLLENPIYPAAIRTFRFHSGKTLPLPVTGDYTPVNAFDEIARRHSPKLVYTAPNFQNPTGISMSESARRGLAELSSSFGVPTVEDDVFGDLYFEGRRIPNLKAFDQSGSIIYINSFSKTLGTGLRLGWIVAARPFIEELGYLKEISDLETSGVLQASVHIFCRRGIFDRHIKRVRTVFRERRDAMLDSLGKYFPRDCIWSEPKGGLFVWVTLDERIDSRNLLLDAHKNGVAFSPGDLFDSQSSSKNKIRLTYGSLEPSEIREGVKILGRILMSGTVHAEPFYFEQRRYPVL